MTELMDVARSGVENIGRKLAGGRLDGDDARPGPPPASW